MEKGGLELLLRLLQEKPALQQRDTQKVACERVLQKSAIALTRLSCLEDVARTIVKLGGKWFHHQSSSGPEDKCS